MTVIDEVNIDGENLKSLVFRNSTIEIRDNASEYSKEWLTGKYIDGAFKTINDDIAKYTESVRSLIGHVDSLDEIASTAVSSALSGLIAGMNAYTTTTTGNENQNTERRHRHHDNDDEDPDKPDEENENDQNPDENPEQDPNQNPEPNPDENPEPNPDENPTVENENLISAAIGAIAFQAPITLYSTVGGEGIQTSSETEYGILDMENIEGTVYYKMIDKKTGKIYYAKADDVKTDEDIQILHTKDNTLILNSTDIGADDNFVKLAEKDSYYVIKDKQEINGVTFATILDSASGNSYYVPVGETVEVVAASQIGNNGIVDTNSDNVPTGNDDFNNYSDDDVDITIDDDSSSNTESLTTPNDSSDTINSDTSTDVSDTEYSDSNYVPEDSINDSEYSDSNYVPEDSINDPEYLDDSDDSEVLNDER